MNICEYISKDSKQYAKMQVVQIKLATKILIKFPKVGKIVSEINQQDIREIIEGRHRIIYKVVSVSQIDILTIHHSARDLEEKKL